MPDGHNTVWADPATRRRTWCYGSKRQNYFLFPLHRPRPLTVAVPDVSSGGEERRVGTLATFVQRRSRVYDKMKKADDTIKYVYNIYKDVPRLRGGEMREGRPRVGSQISKMTRIWSRRILSSTRVGSRSIFYRVRESSPGIVYKVDGLFKNNTCVYLENPCYAVHSYSTLHGSKIQIRRY